jgi:hypothetical protein
MESLIPVFDPLLANVSPIADKLRLGIQLATTRQQVQAAVQACLPQLPFVVRDCVRSAAWLAAQHGLGEASVGDPAQQVGFWFHAAKQKMTDPVDAELLRAARILGALMDAVRAMNKPGGGANTGDASVDRGSAAAAASADMRPVSAAAAAASGGVPEPGKKSFVRDRARAFLRTILKMNHRQREQLETLTHNDAERREWSGRIPLIKQERAKGKMNDEYQAEMIEYAENMLREVAVREETWRAMLLSTRDALGVAHSALRMLLVANEITRDDLRSLLREMAAEEAAEREQLASRLAAARAADEDREANQAQDLLDLLIPADVIAELMAQLDSI